MQRYIKILILLVNSTICWARPVAPYAAEAHLSEQAQAVLVKLTPEEREILNYRRELILTQLKKRLIRHRSTIGAGVWLKSLFRPKSESHRVLTRKAISAILHSTDNQLVENGERLVACNRWGVCGSGGIVASFGFLKWVVGAGAYFGVDVSYDFDGKNKRTNLFVEWENTKFAPTPTIVAAPTMKFFIHFGDSEERAVEEFTVAYLPGLPSGYVSAKEIGLGVALGVPFPPLVSMFASYTNKSQRLSLNRRASCESQLVLVD